MIDDQTLAWVGNGVSVSFDVCRQFRAWYPTSLPAELIDAAVARPEYAFEDIRVHRDGRISFTVRSMALKGKRTFRVARADFGQSWRVSTSEAP